jgi:hypothetical protein
MPEPHKSILDRKNTPLRDGRTPDIASTVLQKVLLSLEGSHMGYPPASLLKLKQTFKLIASYFTITPNFDLGNVDVIAPGQNFQYYAARVNYRLPWLSKKLNNLSPTLNGYRFQFGLTASTGMDRITGPGDTKQHYGFTGGGFVNYAMLPSCSSR